LLYFSIPYNAGRTPKNKGVDCTLKFEQSNDLKIEGSQFKNGKNNVNTVVYSTIKSPIARKRQSMAIHPSSISTTGNDHH
jgi:hypothetical protein